MGDEGVGVYAVKQFMEGNVPENVTCLDGGTGSFTLLGPMQEAARVIIVDAALSGNPPGTIEVIYPKYSSDYPTTLTAHDIGLKDLLDAFYLLGDQPDITLIAISIPALGQLSTRLSGEMKAVIPEVSAIINQELNN